jgi:Domain of unknown function (DUF4395)
MRYKFEKSETVIASTVAHRPGAAGISSSVTPVTRRDAAKRNFILQMGFENPAPVVRSRQFSALVFQPKVVLATIVAGILFQSPGVFLALGAVLWWSAFFPNLNPISALYNRIIGGHPGAFRLGPAPTPRRAAETEAGTIALTIALLILTGITLAAYVFEAIFLAAVLAVLIGNFCTGTFLYHLVRGRWGFIRRTLPWAR